MNGKGCDADGNVCTEKDTCKSGKCIAGVPNPCDDGNPCSVDDCHKKKGCQHAPAPSGQSCGSGKICVSGTCKAACLTWDLHAMGPAKGHSYLFGVAAMGGGVAAVGRTRQGSVYHGWAVIVNAEGKVTTNAMLKPAGYMSWLMDAAPGPGGSVYAAGEFRASKYGSSAAGWVTRFDKGGKAAWHLPIQEGKQARLYGISAGADGNAVAVGQVYTTTLHYYDGWLVKVSPTGKLLAKSSHNIGKLKVSDLFYGVAHANNGETFAVGQTRPGSTAYDGWLMRLSTSGKKIWSQTFGVPSHDTLRRVRAHPSGVVAVGYGYAANASYQGRLLLVGGGGKLKWSKMFGGKSSDRFEDAVVLGDGSVVAAGRTNISGKSYQGWLLRVSADGKTTHEQNAGTTKSESFYALTATADGHLVAVGYGQGNASVQQGWLRKVDQKLVAGCK